MMCLTHILAGALVGRFFRRPHWAFAAGLLSHLPLDMLPHFDSTREVELSTTALGLLAVGAICKPRSPEFWGAVGGALPDLEVALQRFGVLDEEHLIFPTHRYPFLHGENFPKPVIQPIFWVLALGALLLRPGRRKG